MSKDFDFMFSKLVCWFCVGALSSLSYVTGESQGHVSAKIKLYYHPDSMNVTERHDISKSLSNSKFTPGKPLKVIVHGAGSHCLKDDVPYPIIEAYLKAKGNGKEDYNVLCLDYGAIPIHGPIPDDPVPTVRKVYEYTCDTVSEKAVSLLLDITTKEHLTSLADVHIIGHSLGGQIAGYIGRKIQDRTPHKIGRITGLDIANVFRIYSNEVNLYNQLDLSDATFVDIVHTSLVGLRGDYGHVDFYPDGGLHQRSCLTKGSVSNVTELITGVCSHAIVGKYWANSIFYSNITACKDESWEKYQTRSFRDCEPKERVTFGEHVSKTSRGKYYLEYPLISPNP